MKIYFTLTEKQFSSISEENRNYELSDMNFLNLAASREGCLSAFMQSVSFGSFTEREYDSVIVCSGDADEKNVIECVWVSINGAGNMPLEVYVDKEVFRYSREVLKKAG